MALQKLTKKIEIKFWDTVTPLMEDKGPIVKTKNFLYKTIHTRFGFLCLLILVWGSVGFVSGLLIGRLLGILPL
jgi:hypothetical protein